MGTVIQFTSQKANRDIDIARLTASNRLRQNGLITDSPVRHERHIVKDHAAEPIKSLEDIDRIQEYFITRGKYRDNMYFVVGINFGLRVSDLIHLRFSDLIDDSFTFKREFILLEKKTSETRKVKKNRRLWINEAVIDAVMLYLENTSDVTLDDYMFRNESHNKSNLNIPITRQTADNILKNVCSELQLGIHMSTHTLRKTFAYHQMAMSNHDPRKLVLLQKMFGHSSAVQTLDYIGLTAEEMEDAYLNLNLGSDKHYAVMNKLEECAVI